MNAKWIVDRMTDAAEDQSNLCVVLRGGDSGLEALIVADEKGRWSIPGGHAKEGETDAQAAQREVKEETGLEVNPEPLFWARHVARGPGRAINLFYASVEGGDDARPGGGDVTEVKWRPVSNLGDLNGTDRLAIHVAANRVHSPQGIVDTEVELGESLGYAVGSVLAPPQAVDGIYLRLGGVKADECAANLKRWAENLGWKVTLVQSKLFESTIDALSRASRNRQLTPMLETILFAADALWRYESLIAPALTEDHIVIETGPIMDVQRLLQRGTPKDFMHEVTSRLRLPNLYFGVGEDLTLLPAIKDAVEHIKEAEMGGGQFLKNKLVGTFNRVVRPEAYQQRLAAKAEEIAQLVHPFHYAQAADSKAALQSSPQAKEAFELATMELGIPLDQIEQFEAMVTTAIKRRFDRS
jgi:acetyl-CoA carboxylase carboxyl transferase subunit beta